jgi:hypothetical protein
MILFKEAPRQRLIKIDEIQGAVEERTEPYALYGEGAPETVTP